MYRQRVARVFEPKRGKRRDGTSAEFSSTEDRPANVDHPRQTLRVFYFYGAGILFDIGDETHIVSWNGSNERESILSEGDRPF